MVLIKVADISNEARPMEVAEPWLDRLLQVCHCLKKFNKNNNNLIFRSFLSKVTPKRWKVCQ